MEQKYKAQQEYNPSTETLEIRWQNATINYNPKIRVTGGTVARNLVVSVIGIGGNSAI